MLVGGFFLLNIDSVLCVNLQCTVPICPDLSCIVYYTVFDVRFLAVYLCI